MAGEECVFSIKSDTANRTLYCIGVDLDAAVVEEADEAVPVVEAIALMTVPITTPRFINYRMVSQTSMW